jgi:hypothetical protein
LLKTGPVPNPQLAEAEQKIQAMKAKGVAPELLLQAEQEIAAMPQQEVSSIAPDPDIEDCDTEAMACWQYLNSPEGRKASNSPDPKINRGYQNVKLHFMETVAAGKQKAAANAPPPQQKPPSVSINYKDVADQTEADEILAKAGIAPTPKPPGALTPAAHAMLPEPQPAASMQ